MPVREVYPDRLVIQLLTSNFVGVSTFKVTVLGQEKESSSTFELR